MSSIRRPRLRVLANGNDLGGVIGADVTVHGNFTAGSFGLRVATSANGGLPGWADATDTLIDIQAGLTADDAFGGWTSLITGRIDTVLADAVSGVVRLEGRDLSAALIEARTRESFANQTASDIATLFAGRHGLTPQVTSTTTLVGRYYGDDHTRVTLDRLARTSTEWDLLVFLAQQEDFDVFVNGTTLYFQPVQEATAPVLTLSAAGTPGAPASATALRLHRLMTLSGDISVTVRSWNSQQQMLFTETASRSGGGGQPIAYAYVRPNLTQDAAAQLATRKLAALTRHEYVLDATMPGECALSPRDVIQVLGTDSSFDQTYVVDRISRRLSLREGFVQDVRAHGPSGSNDFSITTPSNETSSTGGSL